MITQEELLLNNQSYTNKDFESVYKELIDIAKKISYRYDPTNSNESDPFIVLVKLLAFATDKVNYSMDKELLERFLLSATQEESVRDITYRLGYNMHYYIASQTDVTIRFKGDVDQNKKLPKYTLFNTLLDNINFISTQEGIYNTSSKSINVPVIQCTGNIKTLSIITDSSETTTIKLSNLDSERKLYFPERMVAQNGIFIEGGSSNSKVTQSIDLSYGWRLSENLNTEYYGSLVYAFGYDSLNQLPYIQFPEWINVIIADGLTIKYVICNGSSGNISANVINAIADIPSTSEANRGYYYNNSDNTDNFIITNLSAALNGKDQETIDEAYQGFKKTIGTFNTLVTCRDYANAIYNMLNQSNNNYVSNVQTSDRRTDINYSRNTLEFTKIGQEIKNELEDTPQQITAYDLCIYPLNPVENLNFESVGANGYNKTFTRLSNDYRLSQIKENLEDSKCLSHDYKDIGKGDIILIKILYDINAFVYTNYKVNTVEQSEILLNIRNALASTFNSRELEYGYEIPYDSIYKTILNSDSRIKNVSLDVKDSDIRALVKGLASDSEQSLYNIDNNITTTAEWYNKITSLNILSGKVPLYNYDERFKFDYEQVDNQIIKNVKTITSAPYGFSNNDLKSNSISANTEYTLKKNEVIQITFPSLGEGGKVYPYPVKYRLYKEGISVGDELPAGIYSLGVKDYIAFTYTQNEEKKLDIYDAESNILIETNKPIKKTTTNPTKPTLSGDETGFAYLTQGTEVNIKELNKVTLSNHINAYWITNKPENLIDWQETSTNSNIYEYTLNEDEYFFYSDDEKTYLASCGQGTRLILSNPATLIDAWINTNNIAIRDIFYDGLDSIIDKFKTVYFGELTLLEQDILNLSEGDIIKFSSSDTSITNITIPANYFDNLDNNVKIEYKLSDSNTFIATKSSDITDYKRQIRAILNINSGPEYAQELQEGQAVKLDSSSIATTVITGSGSGVNYIPKYFNFSILEQIQGGSNINLKYINLESDSNYPYLYSYSKEEISKTDNNILYSQIDDKYYSIFGTTNDNINPNGKVIIPLPNIETKDIGFTFRIDSGTESTQHSLSNITMYISDDPVEYNLLTSQPDNWSTNYFDYFKGTIIQVETSNPIPTFENNKYYSKNNNTYKLLINKPDDWTTDYTNYYECTFTKVVSTDPAPTFAQDTYYDLNTNNLSYLNLNTNETKTETQLNLNESVNIKFTPESNSTYYLVFSKSDSTYVDTSVILSIPKIINNENNLLDVKLTSGNILTYLKTNYQNQLSKFYVLNFGTKDKNIDISETYPLSSARAFYDYDNIANKWVLPQINFEASKIEISQTSKLN